MPACHFALAHQGVLGSPTKCRLETPALTSFGNTIACPVMIGNRESYLIY